MADEVRGKIIEALFEPPGGRGLGDYEPDHADEGVLADSILAVLQDRANREELLKLILGPDDWENFVHAMAEQGYLTEVLGWEGPEDE